VTHGKTKFQLYQATERTVKKEEERGKGPAQTGKGH
jgi:hypothetical protein